LIVLFLFIYFFQKVEKKIIKNNIYYQFTKINKQLTHTTYIFINFLLKKKF